MSEGEGKGAGNGGQAINLMTTASFDGLISKFNGTDKTLSSSNWLQVIDENAELFGWSSTQKLIVARRSVTGTAELWMKSEKVFKTYDEFKTALMKEFPDSLNAKDIHEFMSSRKKKKDETYYEYMLVMKELGRRARFADYVTIQYIVDGIVDHEPNKAILYGVTTYSALKEKLAIYENMKKKMAIRRQEPDQAPSKEAKNPSTLSRHCYNCGETGHLANTCKNDVKCYKCNQYGHIAVSCPNFKENQTTSKQHEVSNDQGGGGANEARWQPRAMVLKSAEDSFANFGGNVGSIEGRSETTDNQYGGASGGGDCCQCQCQQVLNVNNAKSENKSLKSLEISGVKVECLIDSGSDVNLMTADLFFELNVTSYVKEKVEFSGLCATKVCSLGKTECEINIDGHCFSSIFYIVPQGVMPHKLIVGQPFLRNTTLVIDRGVVKVLSREGSDLLHCLIADVGEVNYCECEEEDIEDIEVTTGVPRKDGHAECIHHTIIPVLTKLCIQDQGSWYRRQGSAEMCKVDREELRMKVEEQIQKTQEENKRQYNKKRKKGKKYEVVIKITQFGLGLKLKSKCLGRYRVTKVKRNNRYNVEKADSSVEGPSVTSACT